MPTRREFDHIGAYNFRVEIDGVTAGNFQAVEGLEGEIEVVEFQDGDDATVRKRPGRTRYGDVTLEKGYVNNNTLLEWWRQASAGDYTRRNVSIILLDNAAAGGAGEIRRWNMYECWPRAWRLGRLDSNESAALVESVTIVTELIEPG